MQAYILLKCPPGHEREIISQLKNMPSIVEVNGIWGTYDVFAKISTLEPSSIDDTISTIRKIKEVSETYTMHVLYGQGGSIDSE
ncbi:MAG: Lrp/AsnC family transcriptional regulator [Nitrosopumilaceae archaeon]|nr:Lrp/AsnC family transcriptional regulator [Nitrosopumilaceae archaeon]NIU00609.1 Lrp/AsnC family transcriptional regulator [Nitrosopumilaceae archaeon]NIU86995.1 Lrp/AsnC family transcriptional regulator [Nitrosopumilaceae archaeon]NIV66459.1 Lrp/AsnC family transcriptional regulator [Nitrosopumilaceae archaeon]NIX61211.1 Lrp/AsnC family transcriptional regulator [Nitrosopumilaceae archaeon]